MRIVIETAMAAHESALSDETELKAQAIPPAIKTAVDRKVSAQICCVI